jgi:U3 small nucleolar RNA-associated protein 4
VADTPKKSQVTTNGISSQPTRRWWHTYKYRDLLGIVPLSSLSGDDEEQGPSENLEVALIERPMWDVELPGKYVKDYE